MAEYDHIIVGAGSSGSALAYRLAQHRPQDTILLLEAGGYDVSPFIHVPAAIIKAIGNPSLDWMMTAEPDASRNGKVDLWPAGKVTGGSSAINGMLFVRGHAEDYDGWAANGCTGWGYDDLLPLFQRLESTAIGADDVRGRRGPMQVNWLRSIHPLAHTFVKAAEESGVPFNPDYNGASQHGIAYSQVTQRRGWRFHTARAYLWPGKKPSNVNLSVKSRMVGLSFDGTRCTGVRYSKGGRTIEARARSTVVMSAGALATPKLLMASGIGPGDQLQEHGIDPIVDAAQVGQNLQDHPEGMVSIEVDQSTYNTEINSWKIALHGLNWLLFGRGPATSPYPHAVAFLKSDESLTAPDVQIQLGPYAFTFDENGVLPHDKPAISAAVNIAYPKTRGAVRLRSSDPFAPPVIDHELLGHPDDVAALIAACRSVRGILNGPAFESHRIAERLPGPDVQSDDEWLDFLRQTAFLGYHPVGTCRMGSDNDAVVAPDLTVKGVEGLLVADASVMPTLISGNTNATAIVIGEKAADLIAGRSAA